MLQDKYDLLVAREQGFYAGDAPSASLPGIFSYWAATYLTPRLQEIFSVASIEDFYANEICRTHPETQVSILSLGSGEASTEIEIAKRLLARGKTVLFYGTDISPAMSDAAQRNAASNGVADSFRFFTCDINKAFPRCDASIVLANHSLHHFVELEYIFAQVKRQIGASGAFIVNDMIGRNGHQRWPEVKTFVEAFWNLLPASQRVDRTHGVPRPSFTDWDCANGTFEGIRAQDILPLCVDTFEFERFLGFGGIPDVFTDRMYGSNYSADDAHDRAFIDAIETVNAQLLQMGAIKPTIMFATMRGSATDCIAWPTVPKLAVRPPHS